MSGVFSRLWRWWLFWGWTVLAPVMVAELAYSAHTLRTCRALAPASSAMPECGPGTQLGPGESCSVTIPLPLPSRTPPALFTPRVAPASASAPLPASASAPLPS